jgi:hypothetical protein
MNRVRGGGLSVYPRRRCQRRRTLIFSLFTLSIGCALCGTSIAQAQQSKFKEYEVKAAYLYNFGKFVGWPAKNSPGDNSFPICVLGQDPFGPALDAVLANQTIDGKGVVAKRVSKSDEALSCRILFISLSETNQLSEILSILDKASVLTVSDAPEFSQRGGMIQFVLEGNKVRFEVNLTNASNAGLTLSSELLKIATIVRRRSAGD